MKNVYVSILVLMSILAFVVGCTSQNSPTGGVVAGASPGANNPVNTPANNPASNQQVAPAQKPPAASGNDISMDKLYNFASLHSYEYQTTAAGQTTDIKYTMATDSVNGKDAYLQTSEITSSNYAATTKMWMDKSNYACLKISSTVNVNGKEIDTPVQCPTTGPNAAVPATTQAAAPAIPQLSYQGEESITIPLGTFTAKKYSNQAATYWYTPSIPVPLKVQYSGVTTELVSWS